MLLVKTKIGPSKIHGIGLFAAEFIRKGTRIWELTEGFDLKVTRTVIDRLPEASRLLMLKYSYVERDSGLYVICMDDARYFNHSDNPNTKEIPSVCTIALHDIKVEEELTGDYRTFDAAWREKLGRLERAEPAAIS